MKTFKIIVKTDAYNASRSALMNGKTELIIADNLSLLEAQKELLKMLIEKTQAIIPNWGAAVRSTSNEFEASKTHKDGTRAFTIDVFKFSIVQDSEKEVTAYCTSFSQGECKIKVLIDGESVAEEIYVQNSKANALEFYNKLGRIPNSLRPLQDVFKEIREYENDIYQKNQKAYDRYWRK